MKKYSERIPIPILQKTLQSMLLGGDGGRSGRGDLKEVSFMFVLLGGGKYHVYHRKHRCRRSNILDTFTITPSKSRPVSFQNTYVV